MTHADAFLQAILDAPDDDAPRLLFSDWLEEHGEPERGEFIKVQIALAAGPRTFPVGVEHLAAVDAEARRMQGLERRERELFDSLGANPFRFFPGVCTVTIDRAKWELDGIVPCGLIRRGFVEAVTLSAAAWLTHADALTRAAPIREVLTTEMDWHSVGSKGGVILSAGRVDYLCRKGAFGCWWGKEPPVIARILEAEWPSIRFALLSVVQPRLTAPPPPA
jgi:uncharacterized protein (TIGR02996 family)